MEPLSVFWEHEDLYHCLLVPEDVFNFDELRKTQKQTNKQKLSYSIFFFHFIKK